MPPRHAPASRTILALGALAALAACATPRERCIAQVSQDQRVVDQLIAETTANLQRGYALEERQTVRSSLEICTGLNEDDMGLVFCQVPRAMTEQRPVAVDLEAERRKLASLKAKRAELARATQAAVAQCQARYPAA